MELELYTTAGNVIEELEEIKKFENSDELDAFNSITPVCTELFSIICC